MANVKYTPGPWAIDLELRMEITTADDVAALIATVNEENTTLEQAEADAHLIAAAPDLLNGCKALLGLLELVSGRDDMPEAIRDVLATSHRVEEARAAIAKAEAA